MLIACVEYLVTVMSVSRVSLVSYNPSMRWENLLREVEIVDMGPYFSYGHWKSKVNFVFASKHYTHFYFLGADVLDGFYSDERTVRRLELASLATKTGMKTKILGFSYNESPTPASIQTLSNLPLETGLCARDSISQERLVRYLNRPVALVADLAFLLDVDTESANVQSRLKELNDLRARGTLIVGINANSLHFSRPCAGQKGNLLKVYVETLVKLSDVCDNVHFLLIPHDYRGDNSDLMLANAIFEHLPTELQYRCTKVTDILSSMEIKAICKCLDFAISGRMHMAIACLSQGIPVVGITYQGKFEGLFQHFDLEGMTISVEDAFEMGDLADFLLPLIERREELKRQILYRLSHVQDLAQANFAL